MEYQDFITYQPEQVCIVRQQSKFDLVTDPKYTPILITLREKPLPIKEIVDGYNRISEKTRKQTSIYNYLQDLIKHELIVKAGQRVITGKTASEVLYSRKAKLYFPVILSESFWQTEESKNVIEKSLHLLRIYTSQEALAEVDLRSFLLDMFSNSEKEVAKIFENNPEVVNELCADLTFEQLDRLARMIETLIVLLNPQYYEESINKLGILN
jgi:hypothetical protein